MPTLDWIGKDKVLNHHKEVPYRLLDKKYSYGNDADSGNMIIHGDNLEALKALLPQYEGRIKCIYIDPPYNTGNEGWIYNDNVNDPRIKKWLGEVVGKEGDDLSRHDKWLCMMYPRLRLLQKLLADDGFIAISIDNTELFNLKCICDEIFGLRNFISEVSCVNNPKGRSDDKYIATAHEHILLYKKNHVVFGQFEPEEKVIKRYREVDSNGEKYRLIDLRKTGNEDLRSDREDMFYPFFYNQETNELFLGNNDDSTPDGFVRIVPMKSEIVEGRWRWGKKDKSMQDGFQNLIARYMPTKKQWSIFEKDFLRNKEGVKPTSVWDYKDVNSERGTDQFIAMGFEKGDFPNPKPVGTIERLLTMLDDANAIILDSFAGSGTTAHAVLNMNQKDGGNRKFILIEMMDYSENISAERVRRVIGGYGEGKNTVSGTGGGFSYYELGEKLFSEDGNLNPSIDKETIREYIWHMETHSHYVKDTENANPYYLSTYNGTAYYFYYEENRKTALDADFLKTISENENGYVIYADICTITDEMLQKMNITFKKIPRDIAKL